MARRVLLRFLLHEVPRQCSGQVGLCLAAQHVAYTMLLDGLRTRTPPFLCRKALVGV